MTAEGERGASTWAAVKERLAADWTRAAPRDEQAILRERARKLARPAAPITLHEDEVLRTRVGGALVHLPTVAVRSVAPLPRWVHLPDTPRHLLGLARLSTALVAVFDIGTLVTGRTTERGPDARLLTLTGRGPDLSFVVEEVLDTGAAPADATPAPDDAPPFVTHLTPSGELTIDPHALLADPRLQVDHSDEL